MQTIAILFARSDSVYKTLPGCDVWDEARDARKWPGGAPVVAHPPCKRWSLLNNLVLARYPHKAVEFAHGNDGGLFAQALSQVRAWGGVIEHPAQSRAWRTFGLPMPAAMAWQRGVCGGWSIELDQHLFGHPARKRTWLYAVTQEPPSLPSLPSGKVVRVYRKRNPDGSWSRTAKSETNTEISHRAAELTPRPFAEWLVELARRWPHNRKHRNMTTPTSAESLSLADLAAECKRLAIAYGQACHNAGFSFKFNETCRVDGDKRIAAAWGELAAELDHLASSPSVTVPTDERVRA